ncbi:MAG TPA: glycoside hydrolase family 2 TIM barrel-domain containing protein [Paludibacter sp.]|nr:glycoside hydrolase family 2 TIM barrel-domain containing protein [Paludibacter sp.]
MKTSIFNKIVNLVLILIMQSSFGEAFCQIKSNDSTVNTFDASSLDWKLWGYRPDVWRMNFNFDTFTGNWAEYIDIPIEVPGSVQKALKNVGIINNWNIGLNNTSSEWIENRHWIIAAKIPDNWISKDNENVTIQCDGLDHKGTIMINGKEAGKFNNAFIPYSFNIKPFLKASNNTIAFVFDCPPENLAQIGWTSQIKDWKPRFYYGWDWIPRIVQIGIWDKVWINTFKNDQPNIDGLQIITDADKIKDIGELKIKADLNKYALPGKIKISLSTSEGKNVFEELIASKDLAQQKIWSNLKIKRWWPNGIGEQPLYNLQISLMDEKGMQVQQIARRIGFKNIDWLPCEGAPAKADPWICSVNNQPVFLQGVNWTPIRPNFADLKEADYKQRLKQYKELGINTIRVWGGGFAEKEWLYDLCDEMGILVWQDFPLSSSGIDNYPPEGEKEIYGISQIVKHYVKRLQHHSSLLLWCGGNELYNKENTAPITDKHKMIAEMKEWVNLLDPSRRFVVGTPSGPNISAGLDNYGSGNNWDTHGPWKLPFTEKDKTMNAVKDFWNKDDALFHSEVGVPGAMSAEMINKYRGEYNPLPASIENPIWRNVTWWVEWDEYLADHKGQTTNSLEAYVDWSQKRQSEGLSIALKSCKDRFPRCGGFIIWMGHDSFPCMVNTSILDFEGNPKPVAFELSKIWK